MISDKSRGVSYERVDTLRCPFGSLWSPILQGPLPSFLPFSPALCSDRSQAVVVTSFPPDRPYRSGAHPSVEEKKTPGASERPAGVVVTGGLPMPDISPCEHRQSAAPDEDIKGSQPGPKAVVQGSELQRLLGAHNTRTYIDRNRSQVEPTHAAAEFQHRPHLGIYLSTPNLRMVCDFLPAPETRQDRGRAGPG